SSYGNYTLVRVRLKTGRTHQIRVHMKYLGCPILGDQTYSKPDSNFPDATLMLHSIQLKIKLPGAADYTTFRTRVPGRFQKIEKRLRAKFPKNEY
ncbi:MAG: RNA pseudouridine synthase, partial [Lachnospiraceae bacterium]|nr:RNA pseudouridine synthase [Lachnospiraceae bacterium]